MSSAVRISKEVVKDKTSRKQKAGNEPPLREQREWEKRQKGMGMRRACLNEATLEPNPIKDLLVRNTLEYMDMTTSWYINLEYGKSKEPAGLRPIRLQLID